MPESKKLTKKQQRAQNAYRCVEAHRKTSNTVKESYTQLAKKFPALVQSCGLAQSIAFVEAKEKENNIGKTYLDDLKEVMGRPQDNLAEKSRGVPLIEYQHLTRNALESATWIKRYAESLLEVNNIHGTGMQE
jgi:CRISPR-associated protein Cmr5